MNKIRCDVVIVGAGIAGLSAACAAAEENLEIIVVEKGPMYNYRGLHNAALDTKLQRSLGINIDKDEVMYTIMEMGGYRADHKIVKLWIENCDRVFDWLLNLAEKKGKQVILDPTTKPWYFRNYPTAHVFCDDDKKIRGQEVLANLLYNYSKELGTRYLFKAEAQSLVCVKERVTGVIVKNREGREVLIEANKAVILCTGDYGGNKDMVEEYCLPGVHQLPNMYTLMTKFVYSNHGVEDEFIILNTGDGHRMALEIGAAMDEKPHCAMLFDLTLWNAPKLFNLGRQPWLWVNAKGDRFTNEDLPWGYLCAQLLKQPGAMAWSIWDSKWKEEIPKMRSQCCKNMGPPTFLWSDSLLEEAISNGAVLVADSIHELAQKMGIPSHKLERTVRRYNELAEKGHDDDYAKHRDRLYPLKFPPFFATQIHATLLVTLGGLKIDDQLRVLDKEDKPIHGLLAAGNVSGSFFGFHYPTTIPGLSHSRAWTFGYLAGKNTVKLFA